MHNLDIFLFFIEFLKQVVDGSDKDRQNRKIFAVVYIGKLCVMREVCAADVSKLLLAEGGGFYKAFQSRTSNLAGRAQSPHRKGELDYPKVSKGGWGIC